MTLRKSRRSPLAQFCARIARLFRRSSSSLEWIGAVDDDSDLHVVDDDYVIVKPRRRSIRS